MLKNLKATTYSLFLWLAGSILIGVGAQAQLKGKDGISDWDSPEEARTVGGQIVGLTAVWLATMSVVFYPLFWSSGSNLEVLFLVVPDNRGVSLTYFAASLATTAFANNLFAPSKPKRVDEHR